MEVSIQLLILANPMAQFYYGNASTGYVFNESQLTEKLIEGTTTLATACTNLLTEPASTSPARIPFSGVGETIPMSYLLEVDKVDNTTKIEKSDGSSLSFLGRLPKSWLLMKHRTLNWKECRCGKRSATGAVA